MEHDQSETLNNSVDWNVLMENIDFDQLIASSEFDKYFPTNVVETVTKKTTVDKCIQTDPENAPPVFIDLTNVKKRRRHEERSKKHKKRKIDPNEIIFIDSDDEEGIAEEANSNYPNDSIDSGDSGLGNGSITTVRSIIKTIEPNETFICSQTDTASPDEFVIIESDDEIPNISNSNGCTTYAFEPQPMIRNKEICQK